MKLTRLKTSQGSKLSQDQMNEVMLELIRALKEEHFITEVNQVNSSCISLGLHMKSFIIDINKLGYNTHYNPHSGPKRTRLPSWGQRVHYNNIINSVLDRLGVQASIKSGAYTIRLGMESYNETDWLYQKPEWQSRNEARGYYVERGDYKLKAA